MTKQISDNLTHATGEQPFAIAVCLTELPGLLRKEPTQNYPRIVDSTACWRRYIARWEIRDDHLWLVDVQGHYQKARPEPELASWFTGSATLKQYRLEKGVGQDSDKVVIDTIELNFDSGRLVSTQSG